MAKGADFWNDRFAADAFVYGEAPNDFVAETTRDWTAPLDVVDVGAGEGRNAVYLAAQGHRVRVVDYSEAGLDKTQRLASDAGVEVETEHADVRSWTPDRAWDALVTTFLHLNPDDRPGLYDVLKRAVRPGGIVVAEWFRPEQITDGYDSGGPPRVEMMITTDELREHFRTGGRIVSLSDATPFLEEGPHHHGPAATVRLIWKKDAAEET